MATVTKTQATSRAEQLAQVKHSIEMEGLSVDAQTLADGQQYAAGTITADELVERTRARYGLG